MTQEYIDAVRAAVEADPGAAAQLKGMSVKIMNVATDCPDQTDRRYIMEIADGKIVPATIESAPAPAPWRSEAPDLSKYTLRMTGTYENLVKLNKGELQFMTAMSSGAMKIDGDYSKLMSQAAQIQGLQAVIQKVEWEA